MVLRYPSRSFNLPETPLADVLESQPEFKPRSYPMCRPFCRSIPLSQLSPLRSRHLRLQTLDPSLSRSLDVYGRVQTPFPWVKVRLLPSTLGTLRETTLPQPPRTSHPGESSYASWSFVWYYGNLVEKRSDRLRRTTPGGGRGGSLPTEVHTHPSPSLPRSWGW